jgi:cyclic pyranopterin phosphate synthase
MRERDARPEVVRTSDARPLDTSGRRLHDLRISVTDRCNFRCTYCMPREIFGRDFLSVDEDAELGLEADDRRAQLVAIGEA